MKGFNFCIFITSFVFQINCRFENRDNNQSKQNLLNFVSNHFWLGGDNFKQFINDKAYELSESDSPFHWTKVSGFKSYLARFIIIKQGIYINEKKYLSPILKCPSDTWCSIIMSWKHKKGWFYDTLINGLPGENIIISKSILKGLVITHNFMGNTTRQLKFITLTWSLKGTLLLYSVIGKMTKFTEKPVSFQQNLTFLSGETNGIIEIVSL